MKPSYSNLSASQLEMAQNIALYDRPAALRYLAIAAATNQGKCPLCGSKLVRSAGKTENYICSRYSRRGHPNQGEAA